jgi:hypothetical protein
MSPTVTEAGPGRRGTGLRSSTGVPSTASSGPDEHAAALDGNDLQLVQPDRVWAVGRAGREDAALRVPGVVARMDPEHLTLGAVEPREDDHGVTGPQAIERHEEGVLEHEPRLGPALVALLGAVAGSVNGDSTRATRMRSSGWGYRVGFTTRVSRR